jgi:hypothetical protein
MADDNLPTSSGTRELVDLLACELTMRKRVNSRYSIRAFARDLGMDSSALARIMSGARPVTPATAKRLLASLGTAKERADRILVDVAAHSPGASPPPRARPKPPKDRWVQVPPEQVPAMTGWENLAVMCALELPPLRHTPGEVAQRIGCTESEARATLQRLESFGYVRQRDGRYSATDVQLRYGGLKPSDSWKIAHDQYLQKASEALHAYPMDCDISGITMCIDPARVPEAMNRIREFRRSLAEFLVAGERSEVWRISLQLFPLRASDAVATAPHAPPVATEGRSSGMTR